MPAAAADVLTMLTISAQSRRLGLFDHPGSSPPLSAGGVGAIAQGELAGGICAIGRRAQESLHRIVGSAAAADSSSRTKPIICECVGRQVASA